MAVKIVAHEINELVDSSIKQIIRNEWQGICETDLCSDSNSADDEYYSHDGDLFVEMFEDHFEPKTRSEWFIRCNSSYWMETSEEYAQRRRNTWEEFTPVESAVSRRLFTLEILRCLMLEEYAGKEFA